MYTIYTHVTLLYMFVCLFSFCIQDLLQIFGLQVKIRQDIASARA